MKSILVEKRAVNIAEYIINSKCTIRQAARAFDVSKSTVHKDISSRMPEISMNLYIKARNVIEENLAERHLRGGIATHNKYKESRVN